MVVTVVMEDMVDMATMDKHVDSVFKSSVFKIILFLVKTQSNGIKNHINIAIKMKK